MQGRVEVSIGPTGEPVEMAVAAGHEPIPSHIMPFITIPLYSIPAQEVPNAHSQWPTVRS